MNPMNPAADAAELLVAAKLGEYRLLREIGRGGMGVVYQAVQESLDRTVALKVMLDPTTRGPGYFDRFQREAKAAGKLHHTNIVPVYDFGVDRGIHFIAMQFIAGHGLDVILMAIRAGRSRNGQTARVSNANSPTPTVAASVSTTVAEQKAVSDNAELAAIAARLPDPGSAEYYRFVAEILAAASAAVGHAHRQGVVHRDIKPANLLLDDANSVWITDFGLAWLDSAVDLTETGAVVGTTRFMAPERFSGNSDPPVDVYSLGMSLYEMLTLRPAFDESDRLVLVEKIRRNDPPAPRSIDPRIPRDLETIALKAIAKEPSQRYLTADDLEADLRSFLAGAPIAARRLSALEHVARWAKRHPVEAALSGTLLICLVSSLSASTAMYLRSESNRQRAVANLISANEATQLADARLQEIALQRNRAEDNLKKAVAAVDQYLITTSDSKLLQVAGTQPLRRELLESAVKFYRSFLARQQSSPSLRTEVANAYVRIAVVDALLGKSEEATAENLKAIEILRPLLKEEWTPKAANLLANALNQVGVYKAKTGKFKDGVAMCEESIILHEEIVRRDPTDFPVIHNIAKGHTNLCVTYWQARDRKSAAVHANKALEISTKLSAQNPSNLEYKRSIANACQNLSVLDNADGNERAAVDYTVKALSQFEAIANANPKDMQSRNSVARMSSRLADLRSAVDPPAKCLADLERARGMFEKLMSENPTVADFRAGLMECGLKIVALNAVIGRYKESLAAVETIEPYCRAAIEREPRNHSIHGQAMMVELAHASILNELGRHSEALLLLDEAKTRVEKLASSFDPKSELYGLLIQTDQFRAKAFAATGRTDEAERLVRSALARYERALQATPGLLPLKQCRSAAWLVLSEIETGRGNFDAAVQALIQAEKSAATGQNLIDAARQSVAIAFAMAKSKDASAKSAQILELRKRALTLIGNATKKGYALVEALDDPRFGDLRATAEFEHIRKSMRLK